MSTAPARSDGERVWHGGAAVIAVILVAALAVPGLAAALEPLQGTWELEPMGRSDEWMQLSLRITGEGGEWFSGSGIRRAAFTGLPPDPAGSVAFELVREAGTLSFDGRFDGGERGSGSFSFTPSPEYRQRLAELGHGSLSTRRLLLFALEDIGIAYVRALGEVGYADLSDEDLVRFVIHDVSVEYIRAMVALGYESITPEQLVRLRIHDVTPEYVRDVRRALTGS